ncbi:CYTH domain-containing protein [Halomonas sp. HNIBRBA4712]|uniref:CYTH domain-containing protein n=1 Tax=Halomonas sp. HNIBRBA4712 TaxID=3373087 RepID=UPI0037467E37
MKDHAPVEVELKLALPSTSIAALLSYPALGAAPTRSHLANTYYDTPDGALASAGIALRLRKIGAATLQTVKTRGHGGGGLSTRSEWEWPVKGELDLDSLKALPPFEGELSSTIAALSPHLRTDFERRSWLIDWSDSRIELVLDEGEIECQGARATICEVELELKSGSPQALWSLALSLSAQTPLRPSDSSKAARGNALGQKAWALPEATTPGEWLHRATVALDAFNDSGERAYFEHAEHAYKTLAEHSALDETLRPTAAALYRALDDQRLTISFGYNALSLAHRLALQSALS